MLTPNQHTQLYNLFHCEEDILILGRQIVEAREYRTYQALLRKLELYNFTDEEFNTVVSGLAKERQHMTYENGTFIGIQAAQDITEPITQAKLKSFYNVGFSQENEDTLVRYNKLLNNHQSIENTICSVYFKNCTRREHTLQLIRISNKLVCHCLQDFIAEKTLQVPCKENNNVPIIILKLNSDALCRASITLGDVHSFLSARFSAGGAIRASVPNNSQNQIQLDNIYQQLDYIELNNKIMGKMFILYKAWFEDAEELKLETLTIHDIYFIRCQENNIIIDVDPSVEEDEDDVNSRHRDIYSKLKYGVLCYHHHSPISFPKDVPIYYNTTQKYWYYVPVDKVTDKFRKAYNQYCFTTITKVSHIVHNIEWKTPSIEGEFKYIRYPKHFKSKYKENINKYGSNMENDDVLHYIQDDSIVVLSNIKFEALKEDIYNSLFSARLMSTPITGIPTVTNVNIIINGDGRPYVKIRGISLASIIWLPGVDVNATSSNNPNDMLKFFGIDAARYTLEKELGLCISNNLSIQNQDAISLIGAAMTKTGIIAGINARGLAASQANFLTKLTFENVIDVVSSASTEITDNVNDMASAIIIGLPLSSTF